MKKISIFLIFPLLVGACLPFPAAVPETSPNVNLQATVDLLVQSSVEQTMAALPSPTLVPATNTAEPTSTVVINDATATNTPAVTLESNLTTTPVTATSGTPLNTVSAPSSTATLSTGLGGSPTVTPTLGILTYGTLPPAVAYAQIILVNKSEVQAYISLQNQPEKGSVSILEYPVKKLVTVKAPLGYYQYVAWVGGRQLTGSFTLGKGDELTITLYKDRITIQ